MRSLSDTLQRLSALKSAQLASGKRVSPSRLEEMTGFGANPGNLLAKIYIPRRLAKNAPLVVVLHGCTQTAADYDHGSGWSQLADRYGFALLFPEQQRANNALCCFNWFVPEDMRRGSGEALSIRKMMEFMVAKFGLDAKQVFVTGLSAGGAMAAAMLATYPEAFAGGAIIAGLPFGIATGIPEAFDRMRGHGLPNVEALQGALHGASEYKGPWPTISVWHGSADHTVAPVNARAIIDQWRGVHALGEAPTERDVVSGYPHLVWRDATGRAAIEEYSITGMGHGTPIDPGRPGGCGAAGPYMLAVGISSTRCIARSWGLDQGADADISDVEPEVPEVSSPVPMPAFLRHAPSAGTATIASRLSGVKKTIEDALRTAGLMR